MVQIRPLLDPSSRWEEGRRRRGGERKDGQPKHNWAKWREIGHATEREEEEGGGNTLHADESLERQRQGKEMRTENI